MMISLVNTYSQEDQAPRQHLQLTKSQVVVRQVFTIHHQILIKGSNFEHLHQL